MEKKKQFSRKILLWRKSNNFDSMFPWRNSQDKYKILVSEILLKKTTRKQVAKEWNLFIKNYPNFEKIKKGDIRRLTKILRPLGLEHSRGKGLKRLALNIIKKHQGKVPKTKVDLLGLPGVGPYTANAVLCFAFQKDISMVDTNILRVLQRIFGIKSKNNRPRQDKKIWEFAESLPPKGKGKDFNYGILDFGAEVCTAKNPKCSTCVMKKICNYYSESISI